MEVLKKKKKRILSINVLVILFFKRCYKILFLDVINIGKLFGKDCGSTRLKMYVEVRE